MMNKKGMIGLTEIVLIIAGIVVLLGLGTGLKVISIIKSIPTWAWIGILILLLFLIMGRRKK